jgi:hypothetical protein
MIFEPYGALGSLYGALKILMMVLLNLKGYFGDIAGLINILAAVSKYLTASPS